MFLKTLCAAALVLLLAGDSLSKGGQRPEKEAPKHTIPEIMQKVMKQHLCQEVAAGNTDAKRSAELVELLTELQQSHPPRGTEQSWQEKTGALVNAAKAVAAGEPHAGERLTKAANCGACHRVHKSS